MHLARLCKMRFSYFLQYFLQFLESILIFRVIVDFASARISYYHFHLSSFTCYGCCCFIETSLDGHISVRTIINAWNFEWVYASLSLIIDLTSLKRLRNLVRVVQFCTILRFVRNCLLLLYRVPLNVISAEFFYVRFSSFRNSVISM